MAESISPPSIQPAIEFPQFEKIKKPTQILHDISVNGVAKINSRVLETGIQVSINNKTLSLRYPKSIWKRFPKIHKKILSQNVAYATTFHLPFIKKSLSKMIYNIPVPLSESYLFKSFTLSLPSNALMQKNKEDKFTSNLIRRLFNIDYVFNNKKPDIPPYNRNSYSNHAIMPFTFGKDSLLTFALAKEVGITVHPVYIQEPDYPFEAEAKKVLAKTFGKEFKLKLNFQKNNLGILRENSGWSGWELQLTQYSLMLLPYVYSKKAGYILFSNEQSCDNSIIDRDGFRCNPVFEQSHSWLLQNSLMTSLIGGNSLQIGSLLEPINELAIMKILHHRYPEIAKYQSSCDLEYKPSGNGRWCEDCSKCARMYIFLLAIGVNPKKVGFKRNLLAQKYRGLYSIFETKKIKAYGFDQSKAGMDEQVFSFLLAWEKGIKGILMTTFVKKYLSFAQKNKTSFHKKFFGIHSSKTVPSEYKSKVMRIYKQELSGLY